MEQAAQERSVTIAALPCTTMPTIPGYVIVGQLGIVAALLLSGCAGTTIEELEEPAGRSQAVKACSTIANIPEDAPPLDGLVAMRNASTIADEAATLNSEYEPISDSIDGLIATVTSEKTNMDEARTAWVEMATECNKL